MKCNPSKGEELVIWYGKKYMPFVAYHGQVCRVVIPGRGKPRNHGVEVGGKLVAIPAGNLRPLEWLRTKRKAKPVTGQHALPLD